jgi:hypothetical protein
MSYLTAVLASASLVKREWNKNERLALQSAVHEVLPKHRASACLRNRLGSSQVTVSKTKEGGTRLGGLMVCDAFHVCPVCHHRKMAQEQATVSRIVGDHYEDGGNMVDAVLTVPHSAGESLVQVIERLESVWKELRGKSAWNPLTRELGIVGCIRRLETTITANGWHPHYHVSFLCDLAQASEVGGRNWLNAVDDAYATVSAAWSDAAKKAGIRVSLHAQAAVTIVGAVDAARAVMYTMKNMGYGDKENSLTPFDLLRIIAQMPGSVAAHAATRLFAEYADAIKGKHSVSYIGTARSARAIPDAKDKTAADEGVERLGTVSGEAWTAVVKSGMREVVAQVSTRDELATAIACAASLAGHDCIPPGWLILAPAIKSVIEVKRDA